jgi:hypothetical protein
MFWSERLELLEQVRVQAAFFSSQRLCGLGLNEMGESCALAVLDVNLERPAARPCRQTSAHRFDQRQ